MQQNTKNIQPSSSDMGIMSLTYALTEIAEQTTVGNSLLESIKEDFNEYNPKDFE